MPEQVASMPPGQAAKQPRAIARPTIYIDVTVGQQRLSFDVPTAQELVREVTAALNAINPPPKKKPPATRKRPAKKRTQKGK